MKSWWRMLFTHGDNITHDLARYLAALSVLQFLFLAGWGVVHNNTPFDMQSFGIGIGATFTGLGAYFGFRGGKNADKS